MINFEISSDEAIKLIENRLGEMKSKAPATLKKAINKTAKQARKSLALKAQQTYTVKSVRFNKNMKIKNSTNNHLVATIKTTGKPMPLSNFRTKSSNTDSTKAKVVKANKFKSLTIAGGETSGKDLKSFVVKFSSGHVAVAQRIPGTKMKNKNKEQIKEFYSLSIPKMVGSEKRVYGQIRGQIRSNLKKNIDEEINKLLGG